MLNDRLIGLRALSGRRWLRSLSSLMLAGALLSTAACKDDTTPPPPPEEKPLSAQAEKGLTLAPFELDTTGLSNAEKERIGTGSYYVNSIAGCNDCHRTAQQSGPPKYLSGGISYAIGPDAVVYARNLTSDPDVGLRMTEDQFVEAMRTGKDFKSESGTEQLIVMPWQTLRWMTDEDLKSIYAYLQKVPAIHNVVPADIKGAAAQARPVPFPTTYTDGDVSRPLPESDGTLNEDRGLAIQPRTEPSGLASLSDADKALYARGSYLVNSLGDCSGCHTFPSRDRITAKITTAKYLTGGQDWVAPPGVNAALRYTRALSANLLGASNGAIARMTFDQFKTIITTSKVTHGTLNRNLAFPMSGVAAALKNATDDDLQAIFTYIKTQPPISGAADKHIPEPARYCTANTDCASGETCNTATSECVGGSCTADTDCGACQTCSSNVCAAPAAGSTCVTGGI